MHFPKTIPLLTLFMLFFSCAETLDFNQLDDYVSKPVITTALVNFNVTPAKFYDSTGLIQQNSISDISYFDGLNNTFVRDHVVKLEFNADLKNEFDRKITISVELLDTNNSLVYTLTPITVNKNDVSATYFHQVIIATNRSILNATKIRLTAELENLPTPINPNDLSEFDLKSSVTLYVESSI